MISRPARTAARAALVAAALASAAVALRLDAAPEKEPAKKPADNAAPGTPGAPGPGPNAIAPLLSRTVFPAVVKVYGAGGFTGMPSYGT
ncbi:hypothetical protein HY251_05810 [bacterium]|nr:hypothetical protein [bacterium]